MASEVARWRKRMGIEPTKPLLAQSIIGFEDRGRHQSGTRFHRAKLHGNAVLANGCGVQRAGALARIDQAVPAPVVSEQASSRR